MLFIVYFFQSRQLTTFCVEITEVPYAEKYIDNACLKTGPEIKCYFIFLIH